MEIPPSRFQGSGDEPRRSLRRGLDFHFTLWPRSFHPCAPTPSRDPIGTYGAPAGCSTSPRSVCENRNHRLLRVLSGCRKPNAMVSVRPEQRAGNGRSESHVERRTHVRGVQGSPGQCGSVRVRGRYDGRKFELRMGRHVRETDVSMDPPRIPEQSVARGVVGPRGKLFGFTDSAGRSFTCRSDHVRTNYP